MENRTTIARDGARWKRAHTFWDQLVSDLSHEYSTHIHTCTHTPDIHWQLVHCLLNTAQISIDGITGSGSLTIYHTYISWFSWINSQCKINVLCSPLKYSHHGKKKCYVHVDYMLMKLSLSRALHLIDVLVRVMRCGTCQWCHTVMATLSFVSITERDCY